uniref:Uncharacterized protein n=1 Tax=Ditylenchus dipsaci TaxID=166011 RepID=A0A915E9L2_9BILA
MDVQSSSRHLVEIDLTQESGDDTDFTAEEEDTEEEDDIKMEDVSSQVAASTSTKPAADDQTEPQVCIAIEEMDEEDDDESTGSSDSIDDLIDDGQSSKQTTPDPDEPSTSKPDTSTRVHQDESGKGARFIKYNEGVESEESSSRSYVSDSWSELGDDDQRQESAEAQEAVIDEHFKEALAALRANKRDKSMRILLNILADPIVSKEFQVDEWTHFDWTSARTKTSNQRASNLAKIFFSTNVAIAELVENPVPFYMQALSVRPELSELWYECGKAAAKLSDWSTAEFCFKQCNKDDFRAWESLLLLHFLQQNFHECFIYLKKIFAQCKDHQFCDNKFLGENFEKVLDAKVDKQIGDKIANFTSKSSNNLEDARLNPFVEILTQVEVYAPLRLRLDMDMKMEQLGSLICDAFDRIETFSLISEQSIIVEERKMSSIY